MSAASCIATNLLTECVCVSDLKRSGLYLYLSGNKYISLIKHIFCSLYNMVVAALKVNKEVNK